MFLRLRHLALGILHLVVFGGFVMPETRRFHLVQVAEFLVFSPLPLILSFLVTEWKASEPHLTIRSYFPGRSVSILFVHSGITFGCFTMSSNGFLSELDGSQLLCNHNGQICSSQFLAPVLLFHSIVAFPNRGGSVRGSDRPSHCSLACIRQCEMVGVEFSSCLKQGGIRQFVFRLLECMNSLASTRPTSRQLPLKYSERKQLYSAVTDRIQALSRPR